MCESYVEPSSFYDKNNWKHDFDRLIGGDIA